MPIYYNNASGISQTIPGDLSVTDDLAVTDTLTVSGAAALNGGATVPTTKSIALYNTADQTTNFEVLTATFAANVATIQTTKGGTGTSRALKLATHDGSGVTVQDNGVVQITGSSSAQFQFGPNADTVGGILQSKITTGTAHAGYLVRNDPASAATSFSASSGTQQMLKVSMARNQTGTAAATALAIDMTGTGGSGSQRMIDAQVGGVTKFAITAAPSSGNTGMTLHYHNGASETAQTVSIGAADSGGAGFKVLRVPN